MISAAIFHWQQFICATGKYILYDTRQLFTMFYGCSLCAHSFDFDAVENGYLRRVGKLLICEVCMAELKEALGLNVTKESLANVYDIDDLEMEGNANWILV